MIKVIFRQILILLLSFFTLTILTFCLTQFFSQNTLSTFPAFNDSTSNIVEKYIHYIQYLLQGHWGTSLISGEKVIEEFFTLFPATVELSVMAMLIALIIGLPLGIIAATNKNKWQDKLVISTTLIGYSMPIFWWGILLVLLFSLTLGLTPVASRIGFQFDILPVTGFMLIDTLLSEQPYAIEAFFNALHHLILPTIVLATIPIAIFARVTRSAMINALSSDYIRSSRSKGLSYNRVIWLHALRNAMIPIITTIGLQTSVLITGTLITETIFSWPGIGKWLLEAVYRRDLVTIHGGLLAIAVIIILINILVEIVTHLLNPQLRFRK